MNSRLVEMIARGRLPLKGGQWIDTYNQITDPDCAGTIIAGINAKNHYYVMEEKKPIVLGWTRDEKGEIVDRHPVDVANAVTAAKRDNTQNYVVEPMIYDDYHGKIREDQDTCGTLTTNCGNDAPRNGFKVIEPQESSYRIRKLTPRECFRLMGVRDEDIDRIQAAGISKSQQYKMAGNSIVVNCLAAIFRQLFIGNFNKHQQTEIFN